MLLPYFWLMLLPIAMILTDVNVTIEADVIALFLLINGTCYAIHIGRCCSQFLWKMLNHIFLFEPIATSVG